MAASVYGTNRYEFFKNIGGLSHDIGRVRSDISRYAQNVRRVPQVMFKAVKSGYASGFIGLSAQMNYVLGKAASIIDPSGEVDGLNHLENSKTSEIASRWVDSWDKKAKDARHSMHLVASFPAGTHAGAVECIVRDTCEELLSQGRARFEYIAAIHTDTNNPHGHIIVNRRNAEGEWFYLARDHEFTYDRFKDALVRHAATYGVELNNSSRLSRGIADYAVDTRKTAIPGLEGEIIDFGAANYMHEKKGSKSYFITVESKFGERTMWGVGLESVLAASGADRGDTIRIVHAGKKPVTVLDEDGHAITTHRNDFKISFNGQEFGTFDNCDTSAPTATETASANKRREVVISEAGRYRRFADMMKGGYFALEIAFGAAAEALRGGSNTDELSQFLEARMSNAGISEADIAADSESLFQTIEKARTQLDEVRQRIPALSDAERPRMEQSYFNAVGDMDRLLVGERRREFEQRAEGSVYSDEHRRKLAQRMPQATAQRLEQYGISRDEFMARTNIEACSYALESHWIEQDARAIAAHSGIDISTEAGKTLAFSKAAELHSAIINDVSERDELTIQDWQTFSDVQDAIKQADWNYDFSDSAADRDRGRKSVEFASTAFSDFASRSALHAELASTALDNYSNRIPNKLDDKYVRPERRDRMNAIIEPLGIGVDTQDGRAAAFKAVEARYFGVNSDTDTINEIRDLAKKDTLSFDESKRLVEGLKDVLGENGMERLNGADTKVFKDAGIDIDRTEALRITEAYAHALNQHGYKTDQLDNAIANEREQIKADKQIQRLENEREQGAEARKLSIKDDESYGL